MKQTCIAVIGAGAVGTTTAYTLMMRNIAAEILIVDIDTVRCSGEVLDLADALPFSSTSSIRSGSAQEAGNADIILIAAGARQHPGQTRTELLATNKKIIYSILDSIAPIKKDAILIMITNPVDTLLRCVQQKSGLPLNRVMGSGTLLDSLRLRALIAQETNICADAIHAYVLGEHGDSQFPAWSNAHINGTPLSNFPGITATFLEECAQKARQKAYDIIACKGATFYGVAGCVAHMCESIIFDQKRIMPVSCYIAEWDVCLSMPAILGINGIEEILIPSFDMTEQKALQRSIQTLKEQYTSC